MGRQRTRKLHYVEDFSRSGLALLDNSYNLEGYQEVRNPPYSWGLANYSFHDLKGDAEVSYYLPNGIKFRAVSHYDTRVGNGGMEDDGRSPIPSFVHVHWVFKDTGDVYDADVPVHGHIPNEQTFTGTLWIEIRDNGATLRPQYGYR